MFARITTLRGDPTRVVPVADEVDGEGRIAIESCAGNRGFAVLIDVAGGRILGASYWDSPAAMRISEGALAATRASAAAALGGGLSIERFEQVLAFRHIIPSRGAAVRVLRSQVDPERAEEAIVLIQEEVLARVKGADGLCSFQMLINRESGAGMTMTTWQDQAAAQAFSPVAEQLRVRASDRIGIKFEQSERYALVRTSVQLD